ncbi:MAG TPA: type II secretion system protein [Verrucomicrobiae bacterium]|nr:type II secretion system protein [Verrucomicrobiae bacterium]
MGRTLQPANALRYPQQTQKAAFTLLELLVTVAIISVLAGLMLPVLNRTREQGRRIACINSFRQFGQAWLLYAADHNEHVPPNNGGFPLPPELQT